MDNDCEYRFIPLGGPDGSTCEERSAGEGGPAVLTGYTAIYNIRTAIRGPGGKVFYEQFEPGAFNEAIAGGEVIFLARNHDLNQVLSNTGSGSVTFSSDEHGLRFEATLPDTTLVRDTITDVRHGNLTGMSVGMPTDSIVDTWDYPNRTIHKAGLREFSVVTIPAEGTTSVSARSLEGAQRAHEQYLKETNRYRLPQLRLALLKNQLKQKHYGYK